MINTDNKKIVESLNIPIIDSGRKYWFIRTDSGHLYEEFRNDGYIAIGFNEYVNPELFEDLAPEDEYNLKEEIKEKYETKMPGASLTTLKRFMLDMSEGDVVFIPSINSESITFGIIESEMYIYEVTPEDEDEDRCDYVKRRDVRWIKTIKKKSLDVNFYKIFQSHHTIVDANKYDFIIDRTLESFYIKNNIAHLKININTNDPIDGKTFYNLQKFIFDNGVIKEECIEQKINIQSKGFIELITSNWKFLTLLILFIHVIVGGKIKIPLFEVDNPGLIKHILDYLKMKHIHEKDIYKTLDEKFGDDLKKLNVDVDVKNEFINSIIKINNHLSENENMHTDLNDSEEL